jgi:tetratricopeptide (TPR) repeat protein
VLDLTSATNEQLQHLLPLDVRTIVSARIKQATSTAFALLAAAILGRSFTFAQVCRIAGLNEHEGQAALDEVLQRHLCYAIGDLYAFTHDKLREAVYAEIAAERRALHSRALEVLRSESVPAGLLAYHAQRAGLYEQAFQQYVAAGDEALRLFALRDASAYYESARQLLTEKQLPAVLPETALAAIEHLYIQSGHVCELTNERERAVAIYQAMLAREPSSTATKCIALNLLALVKPYASEDEDTTLLEQGLARDKQEDERGASAETAWQLAQLSVQRFDGTRASQQDRLMEACCLVQVAQAKMNAGYPRDSIIATRAASGVFTELGHDWGRVYAAHHLVAALVDVGMYEEALTLAQEALALARSSNTRTLLYLGLSALARVQWALLDAAAAYSLHREILSVFGSYIPSWIEGAVAAALCADCAIVGEWPEAQSYAVQALAYRSDSTLLYCGLTRWYESEILVRTG